MLTDFRFALRSLRHNPLFALVAILSLALGIGANTAIFTLLDQLILRLLPVKDPQQLVMISTPGFHTGSNRGALASSYPLYQGFQQKAEAFSYVFCRYTTPLSVSFNGQTERINAEMVSGNYFQALGVGAAEGRVLNSEEDDRVYKGHPVVVLSHDYWVNRFGGDRRVIGAKLLLNNYPMTIVGVSAAGFTGVDPSRSPQLRLPIQMKPLMTPGWDDIGDRRSKWVQIFARLKPGFTAESAQASLQPLYRQILDYETTLSAFRNAPDYNRERFLARTAEVTPAANGYSDLRRTYEKALIVLMCMVALVLIIACANVANLQIARAAARRKEIAVRLAIGATRGRLVRQLLTESVVLSVAGGVLGVLLSVWTIRGLLSMLPVSSTPLMLRAEPDLRILAFNLALALATGILFGLAPAIQSTRFALWEALKNAVGAIAGGSVRLRKVLVTAQVALSFLLLAGSGLFVRSLANLKNTNTGVRDVENVLSFQVAPALNGYPAERVDSLYRELLDNIRRVPGVSSAAFSSIPLLHGWAWAQAISVEGHSAKDGEDMAAHLNALSPGYFSTLGIPLLEGRDIEDRDLQHQARGVCVVNRRFADHFFPGRSAVGRHIGFGGGQKPQIEIVGVVENALYEGPREGLHRQVYLPNRGSVSSVAFYVRAGMDSKAIYPALQAEVKKLDPAMPVYELKTLANQLDETLATERLIATLSAAFGILATLLAALGLYGVMAFAVVRRTKELGLRLALGAPPAGVLWLVIREVLVLLGCGLAIGIPVAYALSRYVSWQLFNVQPADPLTAMAAVAILSIISLAAGFLPARRASTVDPLIALRYE